MSQAQAAVIDEQRQRQREILALVGILILALAVRLILAGLDRVIRWDEPDYLILGVNLFSGLGYSSGGVPELHYTPLFPLLAGLAYRLLHDPEAASNAVYTVAGTLLILPVYAIARRVYGRWTALATAAMLAVVPALTASVLYWGTMTEPLYILFLYSGFACALWALEDDRLWAYAAAGALISLAYLTRPEALISLALVVGYLALVRLAQRRLLTRRTLARLAGCLLAFALVAAPYIGFLYAKSGKLLVTGKLGLTYALGQAVLDKDPAEYDRLIASLDSTGKELVWYSPERFSYSVVADLLADPLAFTRRMLANTRILAGRLFAHTMFPTFLGLPLALGWIETAWDRRRLRREGLLLTIAVAPLVAFLAFHIEIRFFAPMLPVLLMWAAQGLAAAGRWLASTRHEVTARAEESTSQEVPGVAPTLLVLSVLAFFLAVTPGVVTSGQAGLDWTHKQAGLWLKQSTPAGSVVMARDLAITLYAARPGIGSPNAELAQVLDYARYHHVSYYVIDQSEITNLRPQLAALLDEQNAPDGLTYAGSFSDGTRRTIIYRLP